MDPALNTILGDYDLALKTYQSRVSWIGWLRLRDSEELELVLDNWIWPERELQRELLSKELNRRLEEALDREQRARQKLTTAIELLDTIPTMPEETSMGSKLTAAPISKETERDETNVFVVHGHDEAARETVARCIEKAGLTPIILHEQASGGRTIIEKLERYSNVGFAVVLLTPDDMGGPQGGTMQPRARQNVVAELFYFIGLLGRDRVCPLQKGDLEEPSDIGGVVYIELDAPGAWKTALLRELREAGYAIDWEKALG